MSYKCYLLQLIYAYVRSSLCLFAEQPSTCYHDTSIPQNIVPNIDHRLLHVAIVMTTIGSEVATFLYKEVFIPDLLYTQVYIRQLV